MNETDTVKLLTDYYYSVRLNVLENTSEEYIKIFGVPITGSKEIDHNLLTRWYQTQIPICKMVDLYKDGKTIHIVNNSDTKKIYEAIDQHLNLWLTYLKQRVNIDLAPMEDLLIMDKLAQEIYPYAVEHFKKHEIENIFGNQFSNINANRQTFFKQKNNNKQETITKRESMEDFLKDQINNKNSRWRK